MVVGGVVLLLACTGKSAATDGGSSSSPTRATAVKDEGFSRACATDNDCVVAYFGDTCGICMSSNAAIAKSAESKYQRSYNAARANCPPTRVVGKCAAHYGVSHCSEQKTCTFVDCDYEHPTDEHHCASSAAADGGH